MNDSSRVGNVTSSTGVSSSDSRDGSRGSSQGGQRGRRRDTGVAGSIGGSVTSVAKSSIAGITSVAEASMTSIAGVAEAVVAKQVWVSLSADRCSKEKGRQKHVHVCWQMIQRTSQGAV